MIIKYLKRKFNNRSSLLDKIEKVSDKNDTLAMSVKII
jgi:hypothetical protein